MHILYNTQTFNLLIWQITVIDVLDISTLIINKIHFLDIVVLVYQDCVKILKFIFMRVIDL